MEIRNPNKSHLPELHALLQRCLDKAYSPQAVADRIFYEEAYDPNHVWMAREGGQMQGFLHTTLLGDQAYLKLFVVAPERRRQGLGRDMLSRAEYRLSGEGAKRCWVTSTPPLEFFPGVEPASIAEAFFISQGYEVSAEQTVQWAKPSDPAEAPQPDVGEAAIFGQQQAPEHWAWVEESLASRPARAVFNPASGLCLADPGESVGPLWPTAGASASSVAQLVARAHGLASTRAPRDTRGLRLHQVPGSSPLGLPAAHSQIYASLCKTLH